MTTSPADVARRAAVIVQARGLAKGTHEDERGGVCFMGALCMATTGDARQFRAVGDNDWGRILDAAERRIPSTTPFPTPVHLWNDDPATTVTDVAKLLLQVADDIEFGGAS